ncbi:MAG TPA: ATP synthase F1 subunit delta [Tenuifilaceae bacterium]|nr:ATP synthase F1 subunit delta [Tenuifilaceae bacterium]
MDQGRVCMSYARALLEWASESGIADEVYAQSACLVRLIDENPSFTHLLHTPMLSINKKINSAAKILADCAPRLITLVTLSIKNRREKYLKHILNCYQKLHREKLGIVRTQVEIARELSNETLLSIKHFIANSLKKEIELDVMVDPSLIGGFKLTIDDRLMDKSIRGELKLLRKQFN